MARGQALLARKGLVAAGVAVTYTRDSSAAALTAWVGNTDRDAAGLAGGEYVVRVRTDRDYLLRYADLAAFGEPQPGDTLTETVGGETEVYEVIPRGGVLPPWDWQDSAHTVVRVRCARVSDTGTQPGVGVGWGGLTWGGDRLTWGP